MRLLKHIAESRRQDITEDGAREFIKKNCKQAAMGYLKGNILYRGMSNTGGARTFHIDPKKVDAPRRSTYAGSNYYTLLLDNLPSWKKYPKRGLSLICSTDEIKAGEYGGSHNVYVVLPVDGSRVGVCSSHDIFFSFPSLSSYGVMQMKEFNIRLEDFLLFYNRGNGFDKDWKTLNRAMNAVNDSNIDEIMDEDSLTGRFIVDNWEGSLKNTLDRMLNPRGNGFALRKIGQSLPSRRECWTDGESILVWSGAAFDMIKSAGF